MYGEAAMAALREDVAYELTVLDLVARATGTPIRVSHTGRVILVNRTQGARIELKVADTIGGSQTRRLVAVLTALVFVTCYKIVDMIFELALRENGLLKRGGRLNLRQKVELARRKLRPEGSPSLMQSQRHVAEYLLALYDRLREYRNAVIHGGRFSVPDGVLVINPEGQSALELGPHQLAALLRTVTAVAHVLLRDFEYDAYLEGSIRYWLDEIQHCHDLPAFGQPETVEDRVVLIVPDEEGTFPADLSAVRAKMTGVHPGKLVVFSLEILGKVGEEPRAAWRFPYEVLPGGDVWTLREGDYAEYQIPADELAATL